MNGLTTISSIKEEHGRLTEKMKTLPSPALGYGFVAYDIVTALLDVLATMERRVDDLTARITSPDNGL